MKSTLIFLSLIYSTLLFAGPVLQMNSAFNALMELSPYIHDEAKFKEKENDEKIKTNLKKLESSFKLARHDGLIKHDLFAPSYQLVLENIQQSTSAFNSGKKDFSHWLLKETMTQCLECHSRLPMSVTSSFQNGELTIDKSKLSSPYELGMAYLIVRRIVDAKENFIRTIQDQLITKKTQDLIRPFKQILFIELRIKKDPETMISIIDSYLAKGNLPSEVTKELSEWKKRLTVWLNEKTLKQGIQDEKGLQQFIARRIKPLSDKSYQEALQPDLLLASGLLSNYFFENQSTPSAPEIIYWLGWMEKRLKKEEFMSSGDLFLKQCIKHYPKHKMAKECLKEYRESIEFDFSGSSGTDIPEEVEREFNGLKKLIENPKK